MPTITVLSLHASDASWDTLGSSKTGGTFSYHVPADRRVNEAPAGERASAGFYSEDDHPCW